MKLKCMAFFCLFVCLSVCQAEKLALIVAVGETEDVSWQRTNALDDAAILRQALIKQGFNKNNITVLANEGATKFTIQTNFKQFFNTVQKGDVVFFYFSGNGQRVTDLSADEKTSYDDALVLYDAPMKNNRSGEVKVKHLVDDELGAMFDKLRAKTGRSGEIVAVIEGSYASAAPFEITGVKHANPLLDGNGQQVFSNCSETKDTPNMAPIILFSACAGDESNQSYSVKGKTYGAFTFALTKSLAKKPTTFKQLWTGLLDEIQSFNLSARQTPQVEGKLTRAIKFAL